MADRRMLSKQIIDSDAFIDMPMSTQALYFHLCLRGDDEGFINNPKKIQRMIGASDDDMKILIAKKFIIPFESGVCVIKHWKIHNYIRGDRLQDTVYQEERSKLIIKNNNIYSLTDRCQADVRHLTAQDDGQMSEQDRVVEVRLGEDRYSPQQADDSQKSVCPHQEIISLYAKHLPAGIQPKVWNEKRQSALRARWREEQKRQNLKWWDNFFAYIASSHFLTGKVSSKDNRPFEISLDWICKSENFIKIIEGKYENKEARHG